MFAGKIDCSEYKLTYREVVCVKIEEKKNDHLTPGPISELCRVPGETKVSVPLKISNSVVFLDKVFVREKA